MIKKLFISAAMFMASVGMNAQTTASINVDSRVKYQHVTGFGGFSPSPQWQYWLGDTEMDKLFGKGENQLGLNILRLYIANSKSGWYSGVANAKRAKKYGAFIFASPWSPPASWKSNNSDSNGGSLLESRYADWATYLNDYYLYMKNQGVEIDAVSIQNEPDWNATYQSCIWTGAQLAKFLREQGSKIQCKIIAPEAIHFTKSMHEPILNDAEACKNLDILGGHFYGWDGSSYPLAAEKGKEVWMTEFLINERQQNEGKNIDWNTDGFLFARSINDAMLANMSAWVHYSLKRYYGCLGDGEKGTTNNAITKRGYVLSHYAKYVSGTTRVRHSLIDSSNKLSSSAYLSQTGDSVVVMVINSGSNSVNTTITLPFNTLTGKHIATTGSVNMQKKDLTWETETYKAEVAVAAYSVNTFIFKKSSTREDVPDIDDEKNVFFDAAFANCEASTIPKGWRSYGGETRSAGSYGLGPRLMAFSAEGLASKAFYFRSENDKAGYITYGEESSYRLSLAPGEYTLSYGLIGYKSKKAISVSVRTTSGTSIATKATTPTCMMDNNGTSVRITDMTEDELKFTLKETTNCVVRFYVSSGFSEVLLADMKISRDDSPTGIENVRSNSHSEGVMYDLSGRRVGESARSGIYIMNGKKRVVK